MLLIVITALFFLTDAYPSLSGTCAGGNPIILSPHPDGGSLKNGDLSFKINGYEVFPDAVFDLSTGVYQFELSGGTFNGFLFRLSSSGINTSNKLLYSEDDARDQGSCDSNVAGVSHRNDNPRTSIMMTFDGRSEGDYILDLTAGIIRDYSPPAGKWLYNRYNLRVSMPTPPPSSSPSQSHSPTGKQNDFVAAPSSVPSIPPPPLFPSISSSPTGEQNDFVADPNSTPLSDSSSSFRGCAVSFLASLLLTAPLLVA